VARGQSEQEIRRTSRDAGPYLARMVFAGGLGMAVGGLTRRHQVESIQYSMKHSVLRLFQVGLTVLGRPFREVDRLIRWPEGKGWVIGIREWGVGLRPRA
jgi:hypothetical protein